MVALACSDVEAASCVHGSDLLDAADKGRLTDPAREYDAHDLLDDGYRSLAAAPFTVTP